MTTVMKQPNNDNSNIVDLDDVSDDVSDDDDNNRMSSSNTSFQSSLNNNNNTNTNDNIQQQTTLFVNNKNDKTKADLVLRNIIIVRIIMLSIFLVTGIGICLLVFRYMKQQEINDFHEAYNIYSYKVIESMKESFETQLNALDTFSLIITSYALTSNLTFPFVTLPYWELHSSNIRINSKSLFYIHYTPIVQNEQLLEWAEYTNNSIDELYRSIELETKLRIKQDKEYGFSITEEEEHNSFYFDENDEGILPYNNTTFEPNIWGPTKNNNTRAKYTSLLDHIYLPLWQFSPFIPSMLRLLNFDTTRFNDTARIENINQVLTTKLASLSRLLTTTIDFVKNSQYRHNIVDEYNINDPISIMNYPVFNNFDTTDSNNQRELVGILSSNLYWKSFLINILPSNIEGIICVIKNTANETFTYRIDGNDAYVLGHDDLHNSKYDNQNDDYVVSEEELISYVEDNASPETRGYLQAHLNTDGIQYYIYVYPSDDFENIFITNKPSMYAAVVALIFMFTSFLFLLYDYYVVDEHRKGVIIMNNNNHADTIASATDVTNQSNADTPRTTTSITTTDGDTNNEWQRMINLSDEENKISDHPDDEKPFDEN